MTLGLLAGAGLLIALTYGAAALYVADLITRSPRRRVEGTPGDLGLRYQEIQFRCRDDVLLRGWFMDSPGARATVVLIHDGEGTRAITDHGLLRLQGDYVRRGYSVFAFDLRGRGESSGNRDHLGGAEQRDMAAAVTFVRGYVDSSPLVLHGFGLGGALAIAAVADGVSADAVIADSPFASAREQLYYRWPGVPGPLLRDACWLARRLFDADVDALSPQEAISRAASTPIMLIHGEADEEVPVEHTLNIAAATLHHRHELWTLPGVGHCGAYLDDPDLYLQRCLSLIERATPARVMAVAS